MEDSRQKQSNQSISNDQNIFMTMKDKRLKKKMIQRKLKFKHYLTKDKKYSARKNLKTYEDPTSVNVHDEICSLFVDESKVVDKTLSETDCCNKPENISNTFPEYRKNIENARNISHSTRKIANNLNQSFDPFDLPTKQSEEMGKTRPCILTSTTSKESTFMKNLFEKDATDADLQLGLALSLSMSEYVEQHRLNEVPKVELNNVYENKPSQLEKFGFTSSRPILQSIYKVRSNRLKLNTTPPLLTRSQEERERIITEKIGIILTNKKGENSLTTSPNISSENQHQFDILHRLQEKDNSLWEKARSSPSLEERNAYYVKALSHVIPTSRCNL